ncbi:glycosyl transferase [Priestia megaterium]|uniref:glycosyltransferase n=1 Tax=Priestia megaterium TaxID=1404 RepID=UPI000BF7CE34|nr:glycosyltransferase [Priestia megaterium]PFI65092.1 glycosyl transferase [Priestia megaterium]PGK54227.1 glycosyl transferase [Priestia megaterium]
MNSDDCILLTYMHCPLLHVLQTESEYPLFEQVTNEFIPFLDQIESKKLIGATAVMSCVFLNALNDEEFNPRYAQYLHQFSSRQHQRALTFLKKWNGSLFSACKYFFQHDMMECIPTTVTNAFVSTLKTEQTLNLQITEAIRVFQQFFEKKPVGFFIQQGEYTHQVDMLLKSHEMRYTFVKSSTDELKKSPAGIILFPYPKQGKQVEEGTMNKASAVLDLKAKDTLGFQRMQAASGTFQYPLDYARDIEFHQNETLALYGATKSAEFVSENNQLFISTVQKSEAMLDFIDSKHPSVVNAIYRQWLLLSSSDWLYNFEKVRDEYERQVKLFDFLCHEENPRMDSENSFLSGSSFLYPTKEIEPAALSVNQYKGALSILMLAWEFPPLVIGGLARHVFDLSRALAKAGHHVSVLTTYVEGLPEYERLYGVHVYRVKSLQPHHPDFLTWVNSLNVAMALRGLQLGYKLSFDVIHAHDWLVASAAKCLADKTDRPLITTIHATEHGRNNGIHNDMQQKIHLQEEELIRQSSSIIVCSDYMKKELITLFHVEQDKIAIFPNGIDKQLVVDAVNERLKESLQKKYNFRKAPIIFSIGRIVYEKGFQLFIEAAELFKKKQIDVQFVVAGKGPLLHEFRTQVSEKQLDKYVYFIGYITDNERNQLLQACKMVVFPSLYEPFGIVALEGMVAKKPTIVADTGGLSDIVSHFDTGLTFARGDTLELINCIEFLLKNEKTAAKISENGYRKATTMFSWEKIAIDTSKLFQHHICQDKKRREAKN